MAREPLLPHKRPHVAWEPLLPHERPHVAWEPLARREEAQAPVGTTRLARHCALLGASRGPGAGVGGDGRWCRPHLRGLRVRVPEAGGADGSADGRVDSVPWRRCGIQFPGGEVKAGEIVAPSSRRTRYSRAWLAILSGLMGFERRHGRGPAAVPDALTGVTAGAGRVRDA